MYPAQWLTLIGLMVVLVHRHFLFDLSQKIVSYRVVYSYKKGCQINDSLIDTTLVTGQGWVRVSF